MILDNKTTIEFLERKGEEFESVFNISPMHNWRQVFGYNELLWFFPILYASAHPAGDGVYWPTNPEIKKRVDQKNANLASQANAQSQAANNTENQRFIQNNGSEKVDSKDSKDKSDNKENLDQQPKMHESREHQDSRDSRESHTKFNSNLVKGFDKNLDTVANRKDDNNMLIVHSQDTKKFLKNAIIKNKI